MISIDDIIKLPYAPDLTESGIAYAKRALVINHERLGGSIYAHLRQMVGNVVVELAFRRHLRDLGIPFEVRNVLPYSEPDRYDVALGGRRCSLNTFVSSRRSQISDLRRDPSVLLQAPAQIPEERLSPTSPRDQDLYIFAFLLGLHAASPDDIRKAAEAGQPVCLLHPMPAEWSQPEAWAPLGRLTLKSEHPEPVDVEIGGQDAERNYVTEKLHLEPLKRVTARSKLYSLAYLQTGAVPTARLGVQCHLRPDIKLIHPHEWGNIWVYGIEIWLAGYLVQEEFRRKASTTYNGSRVFQYSQTQAKTLSLPVTDLRPLENLFEQVKNWEAEKRSH